VGLELGPGVLEALLGVELLAPQGGGEGGANRAEGGVEGVGQRVGRVGREHHRAQAGVGAAQGGGGRGRRLAHPALAREQEDAGLTRFGHLDSTCFLSSRSAVLMILPWARRLMNPGIGITSSTSSW